MKNQINEEELKKVTKSYKAQVNDLHTVILKFTNCQKSLNLLPRQQKQSLDKHDWV